MATRAWPCPPAAVRLTARRARAGTTPEENRRALDERELGSGLGRRATAAAGRRGRPYWTRSRARPARLTISTAESPRSNNKSPTCSPNGNPLADLLGAGDQIAATLIAHAGDATLIAHAGDVRRFKDAAAFARFCGAAPIPCGSGQTSGRHRLHRGGNRQLNAALYRVAIVQQRHHPAAQAFLARKIREGKPIGRRDQSPVGRGSARPRGRQVTDSRAYFAHGPTRRRGGERRSAQRPRYAAQTGRL
jgi:hypothetical protein